MTEGSAFLRRARALKALALQSIWGMAEYFAYPLFMFVATPFFLIQLGKQQYGQWMLVLAFNGLGGLIGLGMGAAALKEVSTHRGRGDLAAASHALRACFAVSLVSSVGLVMLTALSVPFVDDVLLAKIGEPQSIRSLTGFALALIMIEQIDTVFAGALRGMERFDLAAKIEICLKFAVVLISAAVAFATHDLVMLLTAVLVAHLARAFVKASFAMALLGTGNLWPVWDTRYVTEAIRFGKWTWLQLIGGALYSTADRLLVGSFLGAGALADYSICLQLAQQVHTVPAAGAGFMFPMVSRKLAAGESVLKVAVYGMLVFGAGALALAAPIFLFGHWILSVWIGEAFAAQNLGVLQLLAAGFVLLALNIGPHYFLLGSDGAHVVAWSNIASGVIALCAGLYAIPRLPLDGAAIMRLIYALALSAPMIGIFIFDLAKRQETARPH